MTFKKLLLNFLFAFVFSIVVFPLNALGENFDVANIKSEFHNADSNIINALHAYSEKYISSEPEKALRIAEIALKIADYLDDDNLKARCYLVIYNIHVIHTDYNKALMAVNAALKIYKKSLDLKMLAMCFNNRSGVFWLQGNYLRSFKDLKITLKIIEYLGDTAGLIVGYYNIGTLYQDIGNYQKALFFLNKSLDISIETNNKISMSDNYLMIGNVYNNLNSYDTAMEYFNKSLELATELKDNTQMSYCYNNIGNAFLNNKEYKNALEYYFKALSIKEGSGYSDATAQLYCRISKTFSLSKQYEEALNYAQKAEVLSAKINTLKTERETWHSLAIAYEGLGLFKKSLDYYQLYFKAKDSIINNEIKTKIAKIEMEYDLDKKVKEIDFLNEKTKNQELMLEWEKEKKYNQKFLFSGIIIIVMSISILFYVILKLRQKKELIYQKSQIQKVQLKAVIDAQERERERFAMDVHDGIGQYFTILKHKISDIENSEANNETISKLAGLENSLDELYGEIRNISFNIMPQIISLKGLYQAVQELTHRINQRDTVIIDLNFFKCDNRLPEHIEVALYRIIQELLNNIEKYSGASLVAIQFVNYQYELSIIIEDNGLGFNTAKLYNSNGYGWNNIKSRIEMINGVIEIDSNPASPGTTVMINVPINIV